MINLSGVKRISLDSETTGLDRHGSDRAIGISVASEKGDAYYAFGHMSGNTHDKSQVKRWAKCELRGKEVCFINPSFDLHMLKKEGIDLEALGAIPRGVQYQCALINEKRGDYSLDGMAKDFLKQSKLDKPCKPGDIWKTPGTIVSPYATRDARLTLDLDTHFAPILLKQGLERVAALEDSIIYAVLHMELQGTILDLPKLARWDVEVTQEIRRREAALKGLNVRSGPQKKSAFRSMGFDDFIYTEKGNACFDNNAIKRYRNASESKKLKVLCDDILALSAVRTIKTNYTSKYLEAQRDGILRYNLHQCRTGDTGTVSGRFSSSGVNIQQVPAESKQDPATLRWIIRELFLPAHGATWLTADASQIEFRLFGHYANAQKIIDAYTTNPKADFHTLVAEMIQLVRDSAKTVNFGMVYGMGQAKLKNDLQMDDIQANAFFTKYHGEFPEARELMQKCMRVARERGYVKTLLGRRRRFEDRKNLHAALNSVLQGSAADIMKEKLRVLYREMKHLDFNLRFTVHDEVDGDLHNPDRARDIQALLNEQSFPLRVPILWKTGVGKNWREAK